MASIDWYDANADSFAARTFGPGMEAERARFLACVPAGGEVLDAGCGSGRDALAFGTAGYRVTAFDGSARLAALASANTGLAVRQMTFAEVAWDAAFDGAWACATLLHLSGAELPDALGRLRRALRPGGVFYASFKHGEGERLANGRHFTDQTVASLTGLVRAAGFEPVDAWTSLDGRADHPGELWVSSLSRRPGAPR